MVRFQIIPVTPFQQNCTVFWNEETMNGAVVDPGGDLALLDKFIDEQGIKVEKILVTHGHLDHAGSVAEMAAARDIPIIGPHKEDKFWIDGMPDAAKQFGFRPRWPLSPTSGSNMATLSMRLIQHLMSFIVRGTRPAMWCSCKPSTRSPWWAMFCSKARSGARIFPKVIISS